MLTSAFIETLRLAIGDLGLFTQDVWAGDAATLAFRTKDRPILDSLYQVYVYVGGSWGQKIETTDYTIDKDTGMVTFVAAPAAGSASGAPSNLNVRLDYKYV